VLNIFFCGLAKWRTVGEKIGSGGNLGAALGLAAAVFMGNALHCPSQAKDAPSKAVPAKANAASTASSVSASKDPAVKAATKGADDKPKIKDNAEIPKEMLEMMDQYVSHEAKVMGGVEYVRDREIARGKISSCLSDCFVVTYLLEGVPSPGSKNSTEYMAAFTYIAGKPFFLAAAQVGGRGLRFVNLKSIGPDAITLTTETYLPKDKISNPTGKGHATYVIADKHMIEVP
jgi:hypothetical protein